MGKAQSFCMKRKTMKGSGTVAITFIAGDGTSEIACMDTDLVFSAGIEGELSKRVSFAFTTHLIASHCKFSFISIFGGVYLMLRSFGKIAAYLPGLGSQVSIKQRHILKMDGEGSSYMGIKAVDRLLESTGVAAGDIDLIICATSNPDYRFPSTASVIAHGSNLTNAYGYDIQAACAGFIVALQDATAYIRSGMYKKVIVVTTEKMS